MASQTPVAIQNENLHIQAGKGALGSKVNVPKSEQKGHKERKALADISKAREPALSSTQKVPFLKNKSALRSTGNVKSVPKTYGLSEDETKRCNGWAKEGIEYIYFSGNDLYNLQRDVANKRVEKEVESIMSALDGWTRTTYGHGKPLKEGEESEDFCWELDPEMLLPSLKSDSTSGNSEADAPFLDEFKELRPFRDYSFVFKLEEDHEHDADVIM
ncbi:uncharacterized protein [Aristolochia californica]|uniref:uncharacterized protein n=1 Tax=Aristolochia californica TaxID=171875 RepID=UPI0035DB9CF7